MKKFSISTKVECAGCCLANDFCIAFRIKPDSEKCQFAYTSHANVVYGNDVFDVNAPGRAEVYRDETYLQNFCSKKGRV